MLLGLSKNLHDTCQLLLLIFTGEDGVSGVEFSHDTPKTPHVNWHPIGHPKDYLRGSIETTLDIRVYFLILEATGSEIDDLDFSVKGMSK